ncbi:MAG TPA: efflux transporter outer membrane subunit [Thermogutta sp.]|nr:efflux transporter outer membrane subunit [Thermogutta sp.]
MNERTRPGRLEATDCRTAIARRNLPVLRVDKLPITSLAFRFSSFIFLILLTAPGCSTSLREWWANGFKVGPNYCRPSAEVGEAWIDSDQPGVRTSGDVTYAHWWTVFNDPTLNELVYTAYLENLPLQIAAWRIMEARYQLGVARGYLWPQEQQAMGAFSRNQISKEGFPMSKFSEIPGFKMSYDDWVAGFSLAWELDFWGRFRRTIESAEAHVQAQEEDYNAALVLLQAEVASTYIQLREIDERLELARKNVALQKDTLAIAKARFEQGVVSQLDVHQAQAILSNTESMIPMLEAMRRVSENRLCTLLGQPPQDLDPILGPSGKVPDVPPEVVVGIPADLLRRRPDVRRAERLAAAQCARIGIAEAEFYPHIAITGQLAYQAENFSDLFNGRAFTGMVGPGFRWNILNYGRIRNSVLMEDARFRQAILGYQETVLRAAEEAEDMITAFLMEQRRLRALQQATEATAQASQLAVAQYQQGLIDFQRVIDSQRALVQQQDALAESRGKVALNLIGVYKALGGGWEMRRNPSAGIVLTRLQTKTGGSTQPAPAPQPTAPSSSGGTLPMAPTDGQNVSPPAAPAPPPEKAPAELPTSPAPPQLPPAPTTRWGDQDVPPMVVPTVGELPEINISG